MTMTLRAVVAGAICVSVLSGMLVVHAWPLWTGRTIYLRVRTHTPTDAFRGEYVHLAYEVDRVRLKNVRSGPPPARPPGEIAVADSTPEVEAIGRWLDEPERARRQARRRMYVQLRADPSTAGGVPEIYVPVSISDERVEGALNLAGRVRSYGVDSLVLDYGIDALFVSGSAARTVDRAAARGASTIAEVAVTSSGHARVRALIIDGRRVE